MELNEAIAKRRSVRNFKNQPLPDGTVEKLIDAARIAPSAGNLQVCEYVAVSKPETKQALSAAAGGQIQVAQASVVIVVCVNQKPLKNMEAEALTFTVFWMRGQQLKT